MDRTDPWFDSLYKKYATKLMNIASIELNNWAVAEELVHEVFVLLLVHRAKVETYKKPGVWLYKVLYNRIGNELRRMSRKREVPLESWHEEMFGDIAVFGKLEDILPSGLSAKDRQILIMFYEEELDCKEISRRLHRSVHACETRLYRARNRCRELLMKNNLEI